MNRILLGAEEIKNGIATFGDERAEHVLKVLHGEIGQILKTGEIGGKIGTAEIVSIGSDVDPRVPTVTVKVSHDREPLASWIDLILAPPRPRVMKRLLPQLATMGVGTITLVGAKKVEKDFWGATLLKSENYRPLLIDGLMQGGVATELPRIELRRNFRKFVNEELDTRFPTPRRFIAHPCAPAADKPDHHCPPPPLFSTFTSSRPLLAIGPEGGWTDDEVSLLESHGFARYSLGRRILRTDTACVALLAQLEN